MAASIRVGISGWRYAPWRGTFYPKKLPQRLELSYAAQALPVIEINGSFYALQKPASYARWYAETPDDFVFTVKGPRYITHVRRLKEVDRALANFFASGVFNLRDKLAAVLWQLPPNFKYDPGVLREFLKLLPPDLAAASSLARKRDAFMRGRVRYAIDANRPLRHALEIRNDSFLEHSFITLMREFNIAVVVAESARKWPIVEDVTADFLYLRLHGDGEIYRSGYTRRALDRWAERIAAWHAGGEPKDARKVVPTRIPVKRRRDVFCFFDNTDVKLRAPFDAQALARKLNIERGAPAARTLKIEREL